MKTESFIMSIQYYEELKIPSVIILLRTQIQFSKPKEEGTMMFSSLKDFVKSFGRNENFQNYHKSSIILSLEEYRNSNFKVGDRLDFDISVNNIGADFKE